MTMNAVSLLALGLITGCAAASARPPPAPPPSPRACEEAYEDLTRYFDADPERRRPPGLHAQAFVATCRELPEAAQKCLLFSYMQSHASQCDERLSHVTPDLMRRIAAMVGK